MCSPTSGGGPLIRPGVSEKSMKRAVLAHAAEQRVVVLGDEPEAFVVAVEHHPLAGLGVDRDLVRDAGRVERARPLDRGARREARLEQRLELAPVLGPRRARREAGIGRELGRAERRAQRLPMRVFERGDLDPTFLRLVQPVQRVDARSAPCRAGAAGTASPSTSSASDANIEPPSSNDVQSSWPSPLTRWWYSAARQPTTESIALAVSVMPKRR